MHIRLQGSDTWKAKERVRTNLVTNPARRIARLESCICLHMFYKFQVLTPCFIRLFTFTCSAAIQFNELFVFLPEKEMGNLYKKQNADRRKRFTCSLLCRQGPNTPICI